MSTDTTIGAQEIHGFFSRLSLSSPFAALVKASKSPGGLHKPARITFSFEKLRRVPRLVPGYSLDRLVGKGWR